MAGEFVEPIARQVRKEARARGQHANRYEPRPPDEFWALPPKVRRGTLCEKATDIPVFHDGKDFCRYCGAFIRP